MIVGCDINRDISVESERQLKGDILLSYINNVCFEYLGFGPYPLVRCKNIDIGNVGCRSLNVLNMHKYQLCRLKGFITMLMKRLDVKDLGWDHKFVCDLQKSEK
jgi:hypothetical protein